LHSGDKRVFSCNSPREIPTMRSAVDESFSQYFPPSKAFSGCGLQVVSMGFERTRAGERYPRREHPADHLFSYTRGRILSSYVIEVLTSGEGSYESEKCQATRLGAGDVYLVFPEVRHRYRPNPEIGWSKWWVEFHGPLADQWMELAGHSPSRPVLSRTNFEPMVEAFENLTEAVGMDQPLRPMLASSNVLQIIARTQTGPTRPAEQQEHVFHVVRKIRHIIHEQVASPQIAWEEMACALGVSYSSLRKNFMQIVGLSPGQYHLSLRQRRGVELLRNSNTSITMIAESLGFESIYYFSRFIKKRTGFSPRALRSLGDHREENPSPER